MSDLVFRAGPVALARIRREGLSPDTIALIGAAAGGPKWLIQNRLDRALFGEWFKARTRSMIAVGSSIGAWRLACAAQRDPVAAIERFEAAYLEQRYGPRPTPHEVSEEAWRILRILLSDSGAREIVSHPWLRLNIVTARGRRGLGSPRPYLEKPAFVAAALANAVNRRWLGTFVERTVLHAPASAPVALRPDGFRTHCVPLSEANLAPALMASASIPGVMAPVRDLPGAPDGAYVDGGMIDYHMDLPLQAHDGIVFLPHFSETVTTGWLDKFLPWRKPRHLDRTLVMAPSPEFLAQLPNGKIPDRHDFARYKGDDAARLRDWKIALAEGQRLADEFMELAASGRIAEQVQPLRSADAGSPSPLPSPPRGEGI